MILKKIKSVFAILQKLFYILTKRQKQIMVMLLAMTFFNAFLQTLAVSAIAPLVKAMTDMEGLMSNKYSIIVCNILNISDGEQLFKLLCISIIFLYVIKNLFCVLQSWVSARFSNKVYRETSSALLEGFMKRPYDFFLNYGTESVRRDINDSSGVYMVLNAFLNMLTELLTMIMIMTYIVVSDYKMAICILIISILCLFLIFFIFRKKVTKNGIIYREALAETAKVLLEAIQGIKEVQVMRKQKYFLEKYQRKYLQQQRPNVLMSVAGASPTYIVEAVFVSGIMAFILFRMISDPSYISALPVLASFMIGAIRMLPSLGRISSNINTVTFSMPALNNAYKNYKILKEEREEEERTRKEIVDAGIIKDCVKGLDFCKELRLQDVSWHYQNSEKQVLEDFNLSIKKGESIGIIGASGAGKSTLADIILALHVPQKGRVELDGIDIFSIPEAYSYVIGYVPQSVYLVDGSVVENVAFGVDEKDIDIAKVKECLDKAQLLEFVEGLEQGLDTVVGERGIRFSGGQRQRIAIARALYRDPQLLVLDEATSALDNDTESAVMESIENLYGTITMIIIAHRLTTVRVCDHIYEIVDGKAVERSKSELFNN